MRKAETEGIVRRVELVERVVEVEVETWDKRAVVIHAPMEQGFAVGMKVKVEMVEIAR